MNRNFLESYRRLLDKDYDDAFCLEKTRGFFSLTCFPIGLKFVNRPSSADLLIVHLWKRLLGRYFVLIRYLQLPKPWGRHNTWLHMAVATNKIITWRKRIAYL